MCSSLDGSHKRAMTNTAAIRATPHRAPQPPVRVRPSPLPHHRVPQVHPTSPRTAAITRKAAVRKASRLALHADLVPARPKAQTLPQGPSPKISFDGRTGEVGLAHGRAVRIYRNAPVSRAATHVPAARARHVIAGQTSQ